jgi:hypothetical protein
MWRRRLAAARYRESRGNHATLLTTGATADSLLPSAADAPNVGRDAGKLLPVRHLDDRDGQRPASGPIWRVACPV